jgi:hypothetical protein
MLGCILYWICSIVFSYPLSRSLSNSERLNFVAVAFSLKVVAGSWFWSPTRMTRFGPSSKGTRVDCSMH